MKIKNLYYQFGIKNNDGFVMPTVLAFIIISSGVILYQSSSLINQIYSIKSSINDLNTIETAINTTRIIEEIGESDGCTNLPSLTYNMDDGNKYQITVNCVLISSNNETYNNYTKILFDYDSISKSRFDEQIRPLFNSTIDLIGEQDAQVTYNNDTFKTSYDQLMYIALVKYGVDDIKILIISDNYQIERNIIVKKV